jgi:hypothetical protein
MKNKKRYQLLSVCLFFIFMRTTNAQTSGPAIDMKITPVENGSALPGVSIKLYQDTVMLLDTRTVTPDGWNENAENAVVYLKANSKYTLVLTKDEYIKMLITLDTHLPSDLPSDKTFLTQADIKMLRADKYPNLVDSDFPLALLQYDKEAKKFLPSKSYANNIKAMLAK